MFPHRLPHLYFPLTRASKRSRIFVKGEEIHYELVFGGDGDAAIENVHLRANPAARTRISFQDRRTSSLRRCRFGRR